MSEATELLFEDYRQKKDKLRHVDMLLASGKTLRVWYSPVMNVQQQTAINKHVDMASGSFDAGIFLTALIVRALNEDGTRMFMDADRKELETKVDHVVVRDIVAQMGSVVEAVDPKA